MLDYGYFSVCFGIKCALMMILPELKLSFYNLACSVTSYNYYCLTSVLLRKERTRMLRTIHTKKLNICY